MNLYAPGSFDGNYRVAGNVLEADCVIGHEFGYRSDGPGLVNNALAKFIARRYFDFPLLVHPNIAKGLKGTEQEDWIALEFEGTSINFTGSSGQGTWGELTQAKAVMEYYGLSRPILVAQAYHVGRAACQAELLGMSPIVPEDLPKIFDPESEQIWTRGSIQWAMREVLTVPVLHHRKQL